MVFEKISKKFLIGFLNLVYAKGLIRLYGLNVPTAVRNAMESA